MSIRVQTDQIGYTPVAPARTDNTGAGGRVGTRPSGFSSVGADHVEVSNVATGISAGVSAANTARTNRVDQLSALYSRGGYSVDAVGTSQALVAQATGALIGSEL